MKKLVYILAITLSLAAIEAFAQDYEYVEEDSTATQEVTRPKKHTTKAEDKLPLIDKLRFGGDVGFSFGNNVRSFSGSLIIFYMPFKKFYLGPSMRYQRISYKIFDQQFTQLGSSFLARYDVVHVADFDIFLQTEYEALRGKARDLKSGVEIPTQWFHAVFIGLGISQKLSNRASINLVFSYNLTWDGINTIYPEPYTFRTYLLF